MTRKDYECIARALKRDMQDCAMTKSAQVGWSRAVTAVMNALKSDNRNFNEDIFMNYISGDR